MYLIVFALLKRRRLIQTKVHFKFCYSVRIKTTHKPSKVAAAQKIFSSVYVMDAICFDECVLFHVVTGRHYFWQKFVVTFEILSTATLLLSLKRVFWKKSVFHVCYLRSAVLITKKCWYQSSKIKLLYKFILDKLS